MCDITTGRAKVCKDGLGGNSSIFMYNFIEDPFTITGGAATAVNASFSQGDVFEFKIEGDGNTLVQNMVPDPNTFTTVNTQTLTALLGKLTAADNANLNLMAKGNVGIVVKDRNGNYLAVGIYDGTNVTVDAATGGAKTDFHGYTLTCVATTDSLAPILDTATVTAFLALI